MRRMMEVRPGHWMVRCRICPRRQLRTHKAKDPRSGIAFFDTAQECHDWWRAHVETDEHTAVKYPGDEETDRLIEMIFGPPPWQERRNTWRQRREQQSAPGANVRG